MYFSILFFIVFHQTYAEVFLDEVDLQMTCNVTRLLATLNNDPVLVVEKTSDVLEKIFGLQSLENTQDRMTNNIERMMITALVMEFIPDLAHWKSACRQGPLNPPGTPQNPIPQDATYKVNVKNKGKAEGGITSSISMLATQRGILNGLGKSFEREAVSLLKLKKSDVTTKFSSIDINTPGTKDGFTTGTQLFNTALGIFVEIPTLLPIFASAVIGVLTRENLWKEISNSPSLIAVLTLDPIAGACRRMKISTTLNSTNPDTWWQGVDSIRAALATVNIDLSYTRACGDEVD
ncbi:uncharacterized protein LOC141855084 [Brevipalpus obovatus]|uniref:uncharacterized protein LOC141855084 n=1 Tax=Brevipalpus obovatus TaxID=246614 RepID=UPI003D9E7C27